MLFIFQLDFWKFTLADYLDKLSTQKNLNYEAIFLLCRNVHSEGYRITSNLPFFCVVKTDFPLQSQNSVSSLKTELNFC